VAGDPPGRIHWQSYSRGRGLYTKTFAGQAGAGLMLDMKAVKAELKHLVSGDDVDLIVEVGIGEDWDAAH